MSTEWLAKYNKVLFHCNFCFPMWSLLLMLHPRRGPFIFRDLGYLYQLVVHGPVPCLGLILPCRNFRLLPSCYVGWPSTSLVRWLPCIWITVLLRHTCVIKVVQCLLFFPDCLPDTESDWQAWYYSSSSIHSYPPQCGGKFSVPVSSCFQSGTFFLRWLRQLFYLWAFQRSTSWHLLILLNTSIISLWKLHCLWGPWGWMPSAILGIFR